MSRCQRRRSGNHEEHQAEFADERTRHCLHSVLCRVGTCIVSGWHVVPIDGMRPFPWWDSADVALSHTFGHATDTSVARYALAVVLGLRLGMRQGLGREQGSDTTLRLPAGFTLVGEMLLEDLGVNPKRGVVVEARGQGIRGLQPVLVVAANGKSGDGGG